MKIDLNQTDRLVLKGATSVISTVLCIAFLGIAGISLFAATAGVTAGWGIAVGVVFIGGGICGWSITRPKSCLIARKTP